MDEFSKEEYYELSQEIEKYHEIFACLWRISSPRFTDEIPTAAVRFDSKGACIDFMINKDHWDSIDDYTKEFTVCHEMLHVILSHGLRTRPYKDGYTNDTLNIALDLAVNHLLTQSFGFNRFYINDWKHLCWSDTVLKDLDLDPNKSFEYYISKVQENNSKINHGKILVQSHEYLESFNDKANNIVREAANAVSGKLDHKEQEAQQAQTQDLLNQVSGAPAGFDENAMFSVYSGKDLKVKRIKKWESVISKYISKAEKEREFTQWVRMNRRLAFMDKKLLLPSDSEIIDKDFYKYNIWLFLDYSGSCSHLKDCFFSASNTFDPRRFNVKKFAHTTEVGEFEGDQCKIWGGGTGFQCIENYIQREIGEQKIKGYPDAIFHFTDGEGDYLKTTYPERWHVFLTNHGFKGCYPAKTNFFKLAEFVEDYKDGRYGW